MIVPNIMLLFFSLTLILWLRNYLYVNRRKIKWFNTRIELNPEFWVLCRIIPKGSLPADNIPVGNVVCGSLRYDMVYNLDRALIIRILFFYHIEDWAILYYHFI